MSAQARLKNAADKFGQCRVFTEDLTEAFGNSDKPIAARLARGARRSNDEYVTVNCFALRAALGAKGNVDRRDILAKFDAMIDDDIDAELTPQQSFVYAIAQSGAIAELALSADEVKELDLGNEPAAAAAAASGGNAGGK